MGYCFLLLRSAVHVLTINDANVQISITTSTSAGLEQILPWIFYHKVLGVGTFFLFVEGKAASPSVSAILEAIPVSFLFFMAPLYSPF